jgi:23S rRNA G2445 N2-methylase RlmL
MATYIATVAAGLEEFGDDELRSLGLRTGVSLPGAVLFDGPDFPSEQAIELLRELNHWARGLDRVGVLLLRGEAARAEDCYEMARARDFDFGGLLDPRSTFAVRASRRGSHDFGSLDVARVVGKAVIESYAAATGRRLPVSLDAPDAILRAEVIDDSFRLWLDATGDKPLYHRDYRRQLHPASMRASMAHLMLRVAGWRGGALLDPMSGIGTIPIEAALYARGIAPGSLRRSSCAIDALGGSAAPAEGKQGVAAPRLLSPRALLSAEAELDVRGIERYERHVQGAWLNLAAAAPLPGVRLEVGDACRLERSIEKGRYGLAVVNPPFGRRVGSTGIVRDLYRRFARSAARCGVRRIVALAESRAAMTLALEGAGYGIERGIAVQYGDLPAHVIVARA